MKRYFYCNLLRRTKGGVMCQDRPLVREINVSMWRSSHPEVFLVIGVLKICSKFTGEHPCRNVISIKLQSKEIAKEHVKEIGDKDPSWHLNIQS